MSASRDGWFISGNGPITENAGTIRTNRSVCRNSRIHNRVNISRKRDLRQFFIKPDLFLEIRDDDVATFRPELQIPERGINRQHLRVRVVNRGRGVATNCIAKFRLTEQTPNTTNPSLDSKVLRWEDGSNDKTIYPRGEDEILNVIFSDSDLRQLTGRSGQNIFALVATNAAYTSREHRAQDGFGHGDFYAELSVRSEEGAYCWVNLDIRIGQNHNDVSIGLSRWDRINLAYKRRPSIVRFVSRRLRNWLR